MIIQHLDEILEVTETQWLDMQASGFFTFWTVASATIDSDNAQADAPRRRGRPPKVEAQ